MLLSFIIPIYNCEQYIAQCLHHIYNSILLKRDYEVILVDDGSKDGSAAVCQHYVGEYDNIVYVHQLNQGPATARNTGLAHANGDYIWFVDADDRINPKILAKLLEVIKSGVKVDLVSFGYVKQYPGREEPFQLVDTDCTCSGFEFLQMPRHGSYLWNNVYRREAIGNVRFLDGVSHIEDACFNYQTIIHFDRVVVFPDIGYYYNRCNVGSISNDKHLRDRAKANSDSLLVYQTLYKEMNASQCTAHSAFLLKELYFNVTAHIYTMAKFDNVRTLKRFVSQYEKMGLYPLKQTGNGKGDLFVHVANRKWLLFLIVRIGKFFKKWSQ